LCEEESMGKRYQEGAQERNENKKGGIGILGNQFRLGKCGGKVFAP